MKSIKQKKTLFLLLLYSLFLALSISSIYLSMIHQQQLFLGDDIQFHLGRIEGLKMSIVSGDYFPKINYFFLNGMGYASNIFYPDLLLYPAALLRLTGLTISQSYVVYLIGINFLTFVISYHSFHLWSRNRQKSILFALLYSLASYRISDVIFRAALGEVLALMILPIAFIGLLKIVNEDYKQFYFLMIGMTLMFASHLITAFIFCLFIIVFLLLNWKKLIQEKQRILYLVITAFSTLCLVAMYFFPMLEQLQFQKLMVQTDPMFYLEKTARPLSYYLKNAWQNIGFNNLGIFNFIMMAVFLFKGKKRSLTGKQLLFISYLFLFLSTSYFPYRLFNQTLLNSIQFPWRFFTIVTLCMSWLISEELEQLLPQKKIIQRSYLPVIGLLLFTSCLFYQVGLKTTMFEKGRHVPYSFFAKVNPEIVGYGREYLPSGFKYMMNPHELIIEPSSSKVNNLKRNYDAMTLDFQETKKTRLLFPIVYYKGYQVEVEGQATVSQIKKSEIPYGFCEVEVNGTGRLTFKYEGTTIQRVSSVVTLVSALCLSVYIIKLNSHSLNKQNGEKNKGSTT